MQQDATFNGLLELLWFCNNLIMAIFYAVRVDQETFREIEKRANAQGRTKCGFMRWAFVLWPKQERAQARAGARRASPSKGRN